MDNYRALADGIESPVGYLHDPTQPAEPPWYVIRMPGGGGGEGPRGLSLSRLESDHKKGRCLVLTEDKMFSYSYKYNHN
jgi:hypothetical protein